MCSALQTQHPAALPLQLSLHTTTQARNVYSTWAVGVSSASCSVRSRAAVGCKMQSQVLQQLLAIQKQQQQHLAQWFRMQQHKQ